jgi:hypothetical protein
VGREMSLMNAVCILIFCLFKICFNIILQYVCVRAEFGIIMYGTCIKIKLKNK